MLKHMVLILVLVAAVFHANISAEDGEREPPLITVYELEPDRTPHNHYNPYFPNLMAVDQMMVFQEAKSASIRIFNIGSPSPTVNWKPDLGEVRLLSVKDTIAILTNESHRSPSRHRYIVALNLIDGSVSWATGGSRGSYFAIEEGGYIFSSFYGGLEIYETATGVRCGRISYTGDGHFESDFSNSERSSALNYDCRNLLWAVDDWVYIIDPRSMAIVDSSRPDPTLRPARVGDGYQGFGGRIQPIDGDLMVIQFDVRHRSHLIALSLGNMDVRWNRSAGRILNQKVDKGEVFVAENAGERVFRDVWCADLKSGEEKWHFEWNAVDNAGMAVTDSVVYCVRRERELVDGPRFISSSYLYALNRHDGSCLWQDVFNGEFLGDPLLVGDTLIVVSRISTTDADKYEVRMYDGRCGDK